MRYSFEQNENIGIFTIKNPELNSQVAPDLKAQFLIVCQPEIEALLIDITDVNFIDSAGIGSVLLAYRQMKEHNAFVAIVGAKKQVKEIFTITRIDHFFEFYATVDDAIEDLTDESYCEDGSCDECF